MIEKIDYKPDRHSREISSSSVYRAWLLAQHSTSPKKARAARLAWRSRWVSTLNSRSGRRTRPWRSGLAAQYKIRIVMTNVNMNVILVAFAIAVAI
jgi:hypothetical protein